MREDSRNDVRHRLVWAAVSLCVAAGTLAWLAPPDTGGAGPARVARGASASVYRWVAGVVAGVPGWAARLLDLATWGAVAALAVVLAVVCLGALRRGEARVVAGSVVAGAAATAAYLLSEALKVVIVEERACRVVTLAHAVIDCPARGDWSFPSNHTVVAAGFAAGLVMLRPRLGWLVVPLAAVAGALRVIVGAHYPHDVLAGAVMGAGVVVAVMLALVPAATAAAAPLLARLPWWPEPGGRPIGDAHDGAGRPPSATGGRHRFPRT